MTHCTSVKDASKDLPIAGSDTATMFESSMISEDTSDAVKSSQNLESLPTAASFVVLDMASPRIRFGRVSLRLAVRYESFRRRWAGRRGRLAVFRPPLCALRVDRLCTRCVCVILWSLPAVVLAVVADNPHASGPPAALRKH